MSARTVLDVMDSCIKSASALAADLPGHPGAALYLAETKAAREAVADLIEASTRARNILSLHDDRCQQLDSALARIGGSPCAS